VRESIAAEKPFKRFLRNPERLSTGLKPGENEKGDENQKRCEEKSG
jgi:hypothetical protein